MFKPGKNFIRFLKWPHGALDRLFFVWYGSCVPKSVYECINFFSSVWNWHPEIRVYARIFPKFFTWVSYMNPRSRAPSTQLTWQWQGLKTTVYRYTDVSLIHGRYSEIWTILTREIVMYLQTAPWVRTRAVRIHVSSACSSRSTGRTTCGRSSLSLLV